LAVGTVYRTTANARLQSDNGVYAHPFLFWILRLESTIVIGQMVGLDFSSWESSCRFLLAVNFRKLQCERGVIWQTRKRGNSAD
jgi:hypothetical protein